MKYINTTTREVVEDAPLDMTGWLELVIAPMPLDHRAYYESSETFEDTDTATAVNRLVKVVHAFKPDRPTEVNTGTDEVPVMVSTADLTREEWIEGGYVLYVKEDPAVLTDHTIFPMPIETVYPTHTTWTLYRPKHPDTVRAANLNALELKYSEDLSENIIYMGHEFKADKDERDLIAGILSAGEVPEGFYFRSVANVNVPMTFAEFQGLSSAMVMRGMALFNQLLLDKAAL